MKKSRRDGQSENRLRNIDKSLLGRRTTLGERLHEPPNSWQKGPLRYVFLGRAHLRIRTLLLVASCLAISVVVFSVSNVAGVAIVIFAIVLAAVLDVLDKRKYYG